MSDAERRAELLEAELAALRAECDRLSEELNESRKAVRRDALAGLGRARKEYKDAMTAHEAADDARDACRAALCSCVIGERSPEEVHGEVISDVRTSLELREKAFRRNSPWPLVIFFIGAAAFAVVSAVLVRYLFPVTAVLLITGVVLLVKNRRYIKESGEAQRQREVLLAKYKAADEEGITLRESEFLELYHSFTDAEEQERLTARRLAEASENLERVELQTLDVLDFNCGTGEAAYITRRYNEKLHRCQELEQELCRLKR